jgi:hypothetical protein
MLKLNDYISIVNNNSDLYPTRTVHPIFQYKDILSETRKILMFVLIKHQTKDKNVSIEDLLPKQNLIARQQIEYLLNKYVTTDSTGKVTNYSALFEILAILRNEVVKENSDQIKYSNFVCTLERGNQDKLHTAISQLKCVPCLNKFTTNLSMNMPQQSSNSNNNSNTSYSYMKQSVSSSSLIMQQQQQLKNTMNTNANMSRLLKQMSLIVITELQQLVIDVIETKDSDKPVKYIIIKEEFRVKQQQQQQQPQSVMPKSASCYAARSLGSQPMKSTFSQNDIRRSLVQTQSCQQLSSIAEQQQQQQQQISLQHHHQQQAAAAVKQHHQQQQQQQPLALLNPTSFMIRNQIFNPYANFSNLADKLPQFMPKSVAVSPTTTNGSVHPAMPNTQQFFNRLTE